MKRRRPQRGMRRAELCHTGGGTSDTSCKKVAAYFK
jgi:hypothetical protein